MTESKTTDPSRLPIKYKEKCPFCGLQVTWPA